MNSRELLRTLRDLGAAVMDEVPEVNYGGCAVLAAIVGKRLAARGIACEVITAGHWEHDVSAAEARPKVRRKRDPRAWDEAGLGRAHLALRFRIGRVTYTWDAETLRRGSLSFGIRSDGAPYVTPGGWGSGLTLTECAGITRAQRGWNTCFDRGSIPVLESIAAHFLPSPNLERAPA